ncbi:DUF4249 domain-containing protein [Pseudoflavitalea sp. X16]|uniref:DUF4249 domain-containing protein n=1 Tax=Paraflavitalea devenefica TaxID=2716334 RepID=UPI001423CE88|nr:DUF4249 domain-containing protein [Paraflavitalea devenefica]NII26084.1 DUF4249 domain-containing protein [Paraflavitalea devenefica]
MSKCFYLLMSIVLLATGCTKDFDIDPGEAAPQYVIDGRISNMQGPYYVRVTKTAKIGLDTFVTTLWYHNAEAVNDALVIMTDDRGMADTLSPVDHRDPRYNPIFGGSRGYYGTTRITGIPGHTYHLQVRIGHEVFQSSAYMPATVPVIDSVVFKKDLIADPSGIMGDAVFAYFKEPQHEQNYYLLQLNNIRDSSNDIARGFYADGVVFPFYVFDDKALPPYVEGMEVHTIITDDYRRKRLSPYWVMPWWYPIQVRLSSLTRHTYEYFKALEKQFLVDGNVYQPAPASASGNISGGALGLFWAANVSHKVAPR